MAIHFDIETDSLYMKGREKERANFEKERTAFEKERQTNILNLWKNGIEPPMISNLLSLPIEMIEQIIAEFQKNKNRK